MHTGADGRGDAFCYFVGSRAAGKSTLLNRFLYPNRVRVATYKALGVVVGSVCAALGHRRALTSAHPLRHVQAEVPKPSEGIEYTYARKPAAFDHEKKDLAHIWEVGGSQEFAEEIVTSDQLFLTAKQASYQWCQSTA